MSVHDGSASSSWRRARRCGSSAAGV